MNHVIEYLEKSVAGMGGELKPPYKQFHHFVLANGREYQHMPYPEKYRRFKGEMGTATGMPK